MFKINGNPEQFPDLGVFHKLSQQFLPYAQKRLGFDKPVGINLLSDPNNAKNPLGKTAYYDPNRMQITVFVDKRHVKDILRSMSHELVHHTQNCRGEFDKSINVGEGYAQKDEHMRKMEKQAYLEGQMILRDWEDGQKRSNVMSETKKRSKNLNESQGPGTEVPGEEETGEGGMSATPGVVPAHIGDVPVEPGGADPEDPGSPPEPGEEVEESLFEEFPDLPADSSGDEGGRGTVAENWTKKNKDKLLFKRLIKKWVK